jgi:hypothetical protein
MMWLFTTLAMANTWAPLDQGFLSDTRLDAPTDGVLLYGSNYVPEVSVIDGPAGTQVLEAALVTGVGAQPVALIRPPGGGWIADETYLLEVLGYADSGGDPTTYSFTTGASLAPAAGVPVLGDLDIGSWTDEALDYPWGCCSRLRTLSVDVEVPGGDPWSYVELIGDFDLAGPSQITEDEIHTHLDVGVGPGPHTLTVIQWEEDGSPQPPCFDIVAVAANGQPGPRETICANDGSETLDVPSADRCGCATTPAPAVPLGILICALVGTRRPRSRRFSR